MGKWVKKKLGEGLVDRICTGKLDANAMVDGGLYRFYTCAKDYTYIDDYAFDDEALLISGNGEYVGYVHYYRGKFNAYQRTYVLRGFSIDVKYLQSYLNCFLRDRIKKEMNAGSIPFIKMGTLTDMYISYPSSLSEQRRIASILSSADKVIDSTQKLIAKYKSIKQGMMEDLLKPKEGWKKLKLGECLRQKPDYGINAPAVEYDNNLPTYLRITDITEDGYYSRNDIVSVSSLDALNYKLEDGDLVFARTGASVGKTYLYNQKDGILVFAGFLIRVRTDEQIVLSQFFKYQTQTPNYKNWIAANSMRTGQPGINGNEYGEFTFYIPYKNDNPDLSEQRRIASILSSIDKKIESEKKVLEKYKKIKKGLMEKLLKGEE